MKTKIVIPLAASLLALNSHAQSTNTLPSFFSTVESYVTTINTNLPTFNANRGTVWTAAAYVQNVNVANALALEYNLGTNGFYGQGVVLNAGIAGTVLSGQGNVGYHILKKFDVDLSIGAGIGYGTDNAAPTGHGVFGDGYGQVLKAFGVNTFGVLRLEEDLTGRKLAAPVAYIGAGVTF